MLKRVRSKDQNKWVILLMKMVTVLHMRMHLMVYAHTHTQTYAHTHTFFKKYSFSLKPK